MPANKRPARTPLTRSKDNSLADLAGLDGLALPDNAPAAAAPTPAPAPVPAITEGRSRQATPAPAGDARPASPPPAPRNKPRGGDPYKGKEKINAYATREVVAAIEYLATSDDRSQGYIVRKYLDIDGLLADAKAAGFEAGEG